MNVEKRSICIEYTGCNSTNFHLCFPFSDQTQDPTSLGNQAPLSFGRVPSSCASQPNILVSSEPIDFQLCDIPQGTANGPGSDLDPQNLFSGCLCGSHSGLCTGEPCGIGLAKHTS